MVLVQYANNDSNNNNNVGYGWRGNKVVCGM